MSSGLWAAYKELANVVNQAILKKQPDAFYSLEAILKKHKPDFISLLQNPVCTHTCKHVPSDLCYHIIWMPVHCIYSCVPMLDMVHDITMHTVLIQARNASHRAQVEKAVKDGLQVPSLPSLHTLPQDFVDEALILSEILDLNEISSVELLLAGEQQLPRYGD